MAGAVLAVELIEAVVSEFVALLALELGAALVELLRLPAALPLRLPEALALVVAPLWS